MVPLVQSELETFLLGFLCMASIEYQKKCRTPGIRRNDPNVGPLLMIFYAKAETLNWPWPTKDRRYVIR